MSKSEKAQSDDMCVYVLTPSAFRYYTERTSKLKWVRLMPFVLNRLNVRMFKTFCILNCFWVNSEKRKVLKPKYINVEAEQFIKQQT